MLVALLRRAAAALALPLLLVGCSGDGPSGPTVGSLDVRINGLPGGVPANVTIANTAAGFTRTVTSAGAVTDLKPGTYTVTVGTAQDANDRYAGSGPATVIVRASATAATLDVSYSIATGGITISALGLPGGAVPAYILNGPGGARNITGATTVRGLEPGSYTLTSIPVTAAGHSYAPGAPSTTFTVAAGATSQAVTLNYALATGALAITVGGLPNGITTRVMVYGPNSFADTLVASETLTNLSPGLYTLVGETAADADIAYAVAPVFADVTIGLTPKSITVTYAATTGRIAITIAGLPGGAPGSVRVTGPGGYDQTRTTSGTLTGVPNGTYTVTTGLVSAGGSTYVGSTPTQNVVVTGAATSNVAVNYIVSPVGTFNLTLDAVYLVQTVQRYDGTVPLIAGKPALLRIFPKATAANGLTPSVRVRLLNGATTVLDQTIAAPSVGVPTTPSEAALGNSYNVTIPGNLMTVGVRLLVELDPNNAVAEANEGDNTFPANGIAGTLDVRAAPPLLMRFIPITQSVNGLAGNVTTTRAPGFLAELQKVMPVQAIDWDVRAVYTTNAPALESGNGNNAWVTILAEMNTLRVADGAGNRHYLGIVKVNYNSGVAGIGYVPGRALLSWDYLPSGDGTTAHEFGHNFGRLHAPCGGVANPDPAYPYTQADIGVYGYDPADQTLKTPTFKDLMGYCNNTWISDFNYVQVLNQRAANNPAVALRTTSGPEASLLVSGRIERGQVMLDPTFEVVTRPTLPSGRGAHRIELLDRSGRSLYAANFSGEQVADVEDLTAQHFAFAIPLSQLGGTPTHLKVRAMGREASLIANAPTLRAGAEPVPTARRLNGNRVQLQLDDAAAQGLMVRDAATGTILSFIRGRSGTVVTTARELEVVTSYGLGSTLQRVRPQ